MINVKLQASWFKLQASWFKLQAATSNYFFNLSFTERLFSVDCF